MKLYRFRTVPLSIISSFSLYTQQWYMSYSFVDSLQALSIIRSFSLYTQQWYMTYGSVDSFRAGSGFILILLDGLCHTGL